MRKVLLISVIIVIICVTIIIFNYEDNKFNRYDNIFDEITSDLSNIPLKYSIDDAIKDNCFVVVHGSVKSDITILEEFLTSTLDSKRTSITLVEYTLEGDPIITRVIFDGKKYYGIADNRRDTWGIRNSYQFEYDYLNVYEKGNTLFYVLVDDNKVTLEEIIESADENNPEQQIEKQLICILNM